MHQIEEEYDGRVVITYKAFPLGATREDINNIFGSAERAKHEILGHWASASRLPGGEEINPELMGTRPFPYPYSMPALRAVKAAEFQGGMAAHVRLYDRLQRAHLVEARDVANPQTLLECAEEIGLDMERFKTDLESDATLQAVLIDQRDALEQGVNATPTVIFNDKWLLPGAVPIELYRQVIDDLLAGRDPNRRQPR